METSDVRLQILHGVLLDHTYANPMPSELPTTFAVQLPQLLQSSSSGLAPVAAGSGGGLPTSGQPLHWSLGGIGAVAATSSTAANNVSPTSNYSMYSSQCMY